MKNHTIEKFDNYTLIKVGEVLTYVDCKDFDVDVEQLINTSEHHVFINCEVLDAFSKDWIRSFLKLQMGLKKRQLSLRLVNVNAHAAGLLKKEGIDTAFTMAPTIKDALTELGLAAAPAPKKSFDTGFINPFLEATMHVLDVQAKVQAKAGKITLKKSDTPSSADISGIIGIVSDNFNGSVVISFPESTFLKIMSSMLGEDLQEMNKDILDGAGEITNMIFGQAKIILNEKGYGIRTALPSVVHGKNHIMSSQTKGPVVIIPFESQVGNFHVEICLSA